MVTTEQFSADVSERLVRAATDRAAAKVDLTDDAGQSIHISGRLSGISEAVVTIELDEPPSTRFGFTPPQGILTIDCDGGPVCAAATILELVELDGRGILRLARPAHFSPLDRRSSFRLSVRRDDGLSIRIWRLSDHALLRDTPKPSQLIPATIDDIGPGGVAVTFRAARGEPLRLSRGMRLRVEITLGTAIALFDGRLSHATTSDPDDLIAQAGIAFQAMDKTVEARRSTNTLVRILADLQRLIARRRNAA